MTGCIYTNYMGVNKMSNINSLLYSGTIQTNLKNTELKMKFEQRKQNPNNTENSSKNESQMKIDQFKDDLEKFQADNKLTAIDSKLKSGSELTEKELEYLREKNPELYKKAMAIKEERKQYKKSLQNAKSKEEVERIKSNKMQAFLTEANSVKNNPNISSEKKEDFLEQLNRRMAAISKEHAKFKASKEYQKLPEEDKIKKSPNNKSNNKNSKEINLKA